MALAQAARHRGASAAYHGVSPWRLNAYQAARPLAGGSCRSIESEIREEAVALLRRSVAEAKAAVAESMKAINGIIA